MHTGQTIYASAGTNTSKVKSHKSVSAVYVSALRIKLSTRKLVFRAKKGPDIIAMPLREKSKHFDASLSLHEYVSTRKTIFMKLN
jgi:hypothetical protein